MSDQESDDENFDADIVIRDFEQEAELLINNLLPQKSRASYLKVYDDFIQWQTENKASFDENVFIVYFENLSKRYKPTSLWSIWSKLKATLNINNKIDLEKYNNLKASLKNKSKGHKPKKSQVLKLNQIDKFLQEADDLHYLAIKVIIILGFFGCLRCCELFNLKTTDFEEANNKFIISIGDTKNYLDRNFIVSGEYYNIIKKYLSLRPENMENRFLVNYQKGKCTRQFIGKNKISEAPSTVASYLQLPEPNKYTGHCLRRIGASGLCNAGGSLIQLKLLGGWLSDSVPQGYVCNSAIEKERLFDMMKSSSTLSSKHFMNHPPATTTFLPAKKLLTDISKVPNISPSTKNQSVNNNIDVDIEASTSNVLKEKNTNKRNALLASNYVNSNEQNLSPSSARFIAEPLHVNKRKRIESASTDDENIHSLFNNCNGDIRISTLNYYSCSCKKNNI